MEDTDSTEDLVEVTVKFIDDVTEAPDGPGWYAWESESPEEGYFWVSETEPTEAELKAICPSYILKS